MQQAMSSLKKEDKNSCLWSCETKKRFVNFFQKTPNFQKYKVQIVEGIDSSGEDGIYTFTKSQAMKEIMSENKLTKASLIIDEVMLLANKKSKKFTMGLDETLYANQMGAVESLVFSDKVIQENDEQTDS